MGEFERRWRWRLATVLRSGGSWLKTEKELRREIAALGDPISSVSVGKMLP